MVLQSRHVNHRDSSGFSSHLSTSLYFQVGLLVAYMLDTGRQKELALAAVWITFLLAGVTDSIAILAAGRHSKVPLRLMVIFTSLSASYSAFPTASVYSVSTNFL